MVCEQDQQIPILPSINDLRDFLLGSTLRAILQQKEYVINFGKVPILLTAFSDLFTAFKSRFAWLKWDASTCLISSDTHSC